MTLKVADRILETSTTIGAGTLNLAGPASGFRGFSSVHSTGSKVAYIIEDGTYWETGIGTLTAGTPDTLSRDTVVASSNANAAVNWGTGTRNVRQGPAAWLTPQRDELLNFKPFTGTGAGTGNAHTFTYEHGIAPRGYSNGMLIFYYAPGTNTSSTVNVNVHSLGNKRLKIKGADPEIGRIKGGDLIVGMYDDVGGVVDIINPIGRDQPRITSIASSATPTPNCDTDDLYIITAQAAAAAFAAPTGTPVDGQVLKIRIKDNAVARALTFNAIYRAGTDIPLPTTTVVSKTMYLGFLYNAADAKWDFVSLLGNI
ncbi:MAG: tail fiber domain protein [Micavibrio sp.]|nr:tail fiber domain protein [Micavibrio sp.]